MNKWLALYAVLCISCIIGLIQLGYEYETEGYGLHPVAAAIGVLIIGLGYWLIAKLFSRVTLTNHKKRIASIINDARKDKRYLSEFSNHRCLCPLITQRSLENLITAGDAMAANQVIAASINRDLFLISHLRKTGKVSVETEWCDVDYTNAAHKHWDELIDQLNG